jgi:ParB/RepB/Spo0J family partition protein
MNTFEEIAAEKILLSKTNPRSAFDDGLIGELAESIRTHGMLQPILVRPVKKGYELVSGERRLRAAKQIGLKNIPCHIMEMNDDEAFEAQIIENLQRKDVHPMDEAAAYEKLLQRPGYTIQEVCLKVGKPAEYVHRRMKLNDLLPDYKKMLFEGKILLGHAMELCRLEPDDQKKAERHLNDYRNVLVPAAQFREQLLNSVILDLSSAPFSKEDELLYLKAGSCTACPKRSGANTTLFGDIEEGDRCFNGKCFATKKKAHLEKMIAERPGHALIAPAYGYDDKDLKPYKNVLHKPEYNTADSKKCPDMRLAIFVTGGDMGKETKICTNRKCAIHWSAIKPRGKKETKDPVEAVKQSIAGLERDFQIEQYDALCRLLDEYDLVKNPAELDQSVTFQKLFRLAVADNLTYELTALLRSRKVPVGGSIPQMEELHKNYHKLGGRDWDMVMLCFLKDWLNTMNLEEVLIPEIKELATEMMLPVDETLESLQSVHESKKQELQEKLQKLQDKQQPEGKAIVPSKKKKVLAALLTK